jgi:hypothetical protein
VDGHRPLEGVTFGSGQLLESGGQASPETVLDAGVVGQQVLEGHQQVYDEVFLLGMVRNCVLQEGLHDGARDFLLAKDVGSLAAKHYPADGPADCVPDLQFLVEEQGLQSSVGLFAHLGQPLVGRQQQSKQQGGFSADADNLAMAEGRGQPDASLFDHVAFIGHKLLFYASSLAISLSVMRALVYRSAVRPSVSSISMSLWMARS